MQRIRSIAFIGIWAAWTALFVPVMLAIILAGSRPSWVRLASRVWAKGFLAALHRLVGLTYRERGRENIPPTPCLIVANHQSTWETIAFLVLFPDVAIVTKHELLTVPVFGWFLQRSPMIVIDRESGSKAIRTMVDESAKALAQGRSVLIFPEGTRSDPLVPVEFKRGVELLYAQLDCPLLPVALNSGQFWGAAKMLKRSGTISVSHLEVIPAGMPPRIAVKLAEKAIQRELDCIRGAALQQR